MTEPKKKNMSRELDEFTVAARICKILEAAATDEVEVEKQVRLAMAKKRAARQEEISGLLLRCPEDRREHVGKLILTRGLPLNGFELGAANDPAQPAPTDGIASDADRSWLDEEPPPAAPRVEIDRSGERKVGKARA